MLAVLAVIAAATVVALTVGRSRRQHRGRRRRRGAGAGAARRRRRHDTAGQPRAQLQRLVIGHGARSAVVIRIRAAEPQPAVIFLHGWRLVAARPTAPGSDTWHTAIAPRYQLRSPTAPENVVDNALAGMRAALQRVPIQTASITVVGHSAGGALAAD